MSTRGQVGEPRRIATDAWSMDKIPKPRVPESVILSFVACAVVLSKHERIDGAPQCELGLIGVPVVGDYDLR